MSINKTIVDDSTSDPLPLSNTEYTLFSHTPATIDLLSGSGFPADTLHIHQPHGHLHITTHRLVFVAPSFDDNPHFKTFSAHLDDISGRRVEGRKLKMYTQLVDGDRRVEVCIEFPSEYDAHAAFNAIDSTCDSKVSKK